MPNPLYTLEYLHESIAKLGLPIAGISPENAKIHPIDLGYATFFERTDEKFFRVDWVDKPEDSHIEKVKNFLNSTIGLTIAPPVTKIGQRQYPIEEVDRIKSLAFTVQSALNSDFIVGPNSTISINSTPNPNVTITSIALDDAFQKLLEFIDKEELKKKRDLSFARIWYYSFITLLIIIMIICACIVFASFFKFDMNIDKSLLISNQIISAVMAIISGFGIKRIFPSLEKRLLLHEKIYNKISNLSIAFAAASTIESQDIRDENKSNIIKDLLQNEYS